MKKLFVGMLVLVGLTAEPVFCAKGGPLLQGKLKELSGSMGKLKGELGMFSLKLDGLHLKLENLEKGRRPDAKSPEEKAVEKDKKDQMDAEEEGRKIGLAQKDIDPFLLSYAGELGALQKGLPLLRSQYLGFESKLSSTEMNDIKTFELEDNPQTYFQHCLHVKSYLNAAEVQIKSLNDVLLVNNNNAKSFNRMADKVTFEFLVGEVNKCRERIKESVSQEKINKFVEVSFDYFESDIFEKNEAANLFPRAASDEDQLKAKNEWYDRWKVCKNDDKDFVRWISFLEGKLIKELMFSPDEAKEAKEVGFSIWKLHKLVRSVDLYFSIIRFAPDFVVTEKMHSYAVNSADQSPVKIEDKISHTVMPGFFVRVPLSEWNNSKNVDRKVGDDYVLKIPAQVVLK